MTIIAEVGDALHLPHYCVRSNTKHTMFYVWINKTGYGLGSAWIDNLSLLRDIRSAHASVKPDAFAKICEEVMKNYPWKELKVSHDDQWIAS